MEQNRESRITALPYNETEHTWEQVQQHLKGIWNNTDLSLDLLSLEQQVAALNNAHLSIENPAELADKFLKGIRSINPLQWFEFNSPGIWIIIAVATTLVIALTIEICLYASFKSFQHKALKNLYFQNLKLKTIGGDVGSRVPGRA
ncbi:Envelope glycoprotein gp70 [Vulpes lagopus]